MNDVVRGTVAPGFEPVANAFRAFFTKAWDVGSAVSVYVRAEPVVRLTGGVRVGSGDPVPYDADTIQLVASTTKFVESLVVALLVDRGLLRYDDRIVEHWPDFAGGQPARRRCRLCPSLKWGQSRHLCRFNAGSFDVIVSVHAASTTQARRRDRVTRIRTGG